MYRIFCYLVLLCLLYGILSAPSTCGNKRDTNIQGTLVFINAATYYDISINSADECCKACDQRQWQCTGWSFCDDPAGCGTGCADYMSTWNIEREKSSSEWNDKYAPLGYTNNSIAADTQCGDKWPYKTCSLKIINNESSEIAEGVNAQGWVSGDTGVMYSEPWKCSYNDPGGSYPGIISPKLYQCADDSCGARQSNIQAKMLRYDVNFGGRSRVGGAIGSSPLECCELCSKKYCDAWVFCNNPEGCGTGCKATIQDLNNRFNGGQLGHPDLDAKLNEEKQCTDNDAFQYRLCSLKTFENGEYEEITEGDSAFGWVSGIPTSSNK